MKGEIKTWLNRLKFFFRRKVSKGSFSAFLHQYDYPSRQLGRKVTVTIYLPPDYFAMPGQSFPLLLLNDGQDLAGMNFPALLQRSYHSRGVQQVIAVGIHAGDRLQEYGTAGRPDYRQRGAKAGRYTQFILRELLPFLTRNYRCRQPYGFAGWSLGGLSAFDIVWNHPAVFQLTGVFSGSFWWRYRPFNSADPDAHRIAHEVVRQASSRPPLRFWFQTGTEDEQADRNNNGVIDAIDDTLSLIEALKEKGYRRGKDICYVEVKGGRHHPRTWAKVMPTFLAWAFGRHFPDQT